jgi:hypothetical protein
MACPADTHLPLRSGGALRAESAPRPLRPSRRRQSNRPCAGDSTRWEPASPIRLTFPKSLPAQCHTWAIMVVSANGGPMGQIFDHRETVMGAAPAGAHSLRENRRAMARRRRLLFDLNAVAYTQSTNTLSIRSPNANLIYSPSRVSQVSREDGSGFVEGQLETFAYARSARAASHAPHSPDRACPPRVMCNKSVGIEDRGMGRLSERWLNIRRNK